MATYDDYIKKLGGKRVGAGEDWKDVHQQVVADYAARNPEAPMPQASGGGEIGGVQQPATPQAAPQLGILPQAPSATTSAAVPGMNVPTPGGPNGFMPAKKPVAAPVAAPVSAGVDGIPTGGPEGWKGGNTQPSPNAVATAPQAKQPQQASAGVDGIPTGGAPGWTGGAPKQAPKTAFGDLQATIQNQVEKAVWGSTLTPSPSTQKPASQPPVINPKDASYRMEGSNYKTPAVSAPVASPTAPVISPQGKVTSLGAGTDVGFGATRFDIPGKSPLFTDKAGASGMADSMSLLNRGPVSAQNQAAMDNLLARSANDVSRQVAALKFKDQVAQAQAINEANARLNPPNQYNPLDLRDPTNIARRNFETSLSRRPNESAADYKVRADALLNANSNFNTNIANTNSQQLAAQRLAAETANAGVLSGQAQQRLGIDGRRADTDAARVGGELATGQLTREEKALGISAGKRLEALQAKYDAAPDSEKAAIAVQIRAMRGLDTEKSAKDKYIVVPGGETTDPVTGAAIKVASKVFDSNAGKYVESQQGAQGKPVPASFSEYEKAVRAANPNMKLDTAVLKAKHAQLLGAQK